MAGRETWLIHDIEGIRTYWLNPHQKRFWAVIAALFYTLLGFFSAPLILKNSIIDFVSEDGKWVRLELAVATD